MGKNKNIESEKYEKIKISKVKNSETIKYRGRKNKNIEDERWGKIEISKVKNGEK
jgi:hypothetical protein